MLQTSPMVDSPVLFGSRTMGEIIIPVVAGIGGVLFFKSSLALLPAGAAFLLMPRLRQVWGRQRLVQRLWAWGRRRELEALSFGLRMVGVIGEEWPAWLLEKDIVRRLRP